MDSKSEVQELNSIKGVSIKEVEKPIDIEYYKGFYKEVGESFNWLDRLVISDEVLNEKINNNQTHVFVFDIDGIEAGFTELVVENNYVEILYFGLLPGFIGKGLGKYLLNQAIIKAWSFSPQWVQLNTCELDHPNALSVYKKLGFQVYKTRKEWRKVI